MGFRSFKVQTRIGKGTGSLERTSHRRTYQRYQVNASTIGTCLKSGYAVNSTGHGGLAAQG